MCCRPSTPPTTTTTPTGPADTSGDASPNFLPSIESQAECGLSGDSAFIRGGEASKLGEFPWTVLLRKNRPGGEVYFHCGGTLINKW